MLGRLARWLRIIGYDAEYVTGKNRTNLIMQSLQENRIVVTRDHELSSKRALKLILITSDHCDKQLQQLFKETGITAKKSRLFTRCTICNKKNDIITDKESVRSRVPEYVFQTTGKFSVCPECKRIYWPGTHWELLNKELQKILEE